MIKIILFSLYLYNSVSFSYANLIVENGVIWTVDKKMPMAQAMVIEDNKITYVGDALGAQKFSNPDSQRIDLKGRLVLPAFIDCHVHFSGGGVIIFSN